MKHFLNTQDWSRTELDALLARAALYKQHKLGDALKGATVAAKIVGHGRADKVRIVKFRRRKHHRKQMGHRQHYTEIEITGIAGGDKK